MAMPSDEDEECSVVLNPLPRSLLRSLSAQGRCSASAAAGPTVVDDPVNTKHRRRHRKHRRREQRVVAATAESEPSPRVNPIFVWVKQDGPRIVEVLCEDYDKRNRIRLTKTAQGWRAIPRTERLVSATALASEESPPPSLSPPPTTTQMDTGLTEGHEAALEPPPPPLRRQRRHLSPRGATHTHMHMPAGGFESTGDGDGDGEGEACAMTPPMSHEDDVEEFEMIKTDDDEAAATRLELDEEDERERLAVEMCERATISEDLIDDCFDHEEMNGHDVEKIDEQSHVEHQQLLEEEQDAEPELEMETEGDPIIDDDDHSDCLVDPETMVEPESFIDHEGDDIMDQEHELANDCLLEAENTNDHEGTLIMNEDSSFMEDPEALVESETIEDIIDELEMHDDQEMMEANEELQMCEEQTNYEHDQEMEGLDSNENDDHEHEYINELNEHDSEEIENHEQMDEHDEQQENINEQTEEQQTIGENDDEFLEHEHEHEQQHDHHIQNEDLEPEQDDFDESRQTEGVQESIEEEEEEEENVNIINQSSKEQSNLDEAPSIEKISEKNLSSLKNNKIKLENNTLETILEMNSKLNYSNKKTEKIPNLEESHNNNNNKNEIAKEIETKKVLNTILGLNTELEIKPIRCLAKLNENDFNLQINRNNNNNNKTKEEKNIIIIKPEKIEKETIIKPEPIEEDELPKDLSIKKPTTTHIQLTPLKIPKVAQHLNKPKSLFLESLLSSPRITAIPVQSISTPPSPPPSTSPIKLSPQSATTIIPQLHRGSGSPTVTCSQDVQKNKRKSEEHDIDELTLKGLLHRSEKRPRIEKQISPSSGGEKGRKSRLLELLTAEPEATPSAQLKRVLSDPERPVPDPLLVPRSRLAELVANPAKEIPRLLTTRPELRLPEALAFPALLRDPDLLVISLAHLHAMTQHPDNLEEDERGCSSLGGFLEWHRYQTQASRNSTTATLNQMLWLPYLSQLEASALACGNNQEFLAMLNAVFPSHGYPPPAPPSPFLAPQHPNGASTGFPGIDFKAQLELQQTLAVWQEAMLQATSPSVKSAVPPHSSKNSRNSQSKKCNNNNNNNNNISTNNNNNPNGFLSRNYASQLVPTHSRNNGLKNGKHLAAYNGMNAFPGSQQLQYNQTLQQVPQVQVPRNNNKSSNDSKRNGVTCKSLLNLLSNPSQQQQQQQQQQPLVPAPPPPPPRPSITSPMDLTSRRMMSNGAMLASFQSAPKSRSNTTTTSTAKLKVKQHLVDPTLRPGRLLKHDVSNTSPDADLATRLQTSNHPALWHPLFGSQKTSYSSPWQWTTVTVNGE